MARVYTVFNVEQCEDLNVPTPEKPERLDSSRNQEAEKILSLPNLNLKHGGDKAYYSEVGDLIVMQKREAFENMDFYYSTFFHEIMHWTGHPDRLIRKFGSRFGGHDYAFEELIAEIGSAFLGASTGIPFEGMRHVEYVGSWLKTLQQDNRAAFTAACKAQDAADYVLDKIDWFVRHKQSFGTYK